MYPLPSLSSPFLATPTLLSLSLVYTISMRMKSKGDKHDSHLDDHALVITNEGGTHTIYIHIYTYCTLKASQRSFLGNRARLRRGSSKRTLFHFCKYPFPPSPASFLFLSFLSSSSPSSIFLLSIPLFPFQALTTWQPRWRKKRRKRKRGSCTPI